MGWHFPYLSSYAENGIINIMLRKRVFPDDFTDKLINGDCLSIIDLFDNPLFTPVFKINNTTD